ncbi:MAG: cell division protein FtsW [Clostridia bacterium]|nr:cell division protein FtsW [Clostridia bacterium]
MALLTVGLVMLFSASYAYAYHYNSGSYHYIKNQLIFAGIGLVVMFLFSKINYRVWKPLAPIIFGISIVLLLVVFAMPAYEGQWHRWIYIGGFSFQPSEIAKFAVVIFFGYLVEHFGSNIGKVKSFIWFMVSLGFVCGLIIAEPHLSGTLVIAALGIIIMIVGGVKKRWLAILFLIGGAALAIYIFGFKGIGYIGDRLQGWLDKDFDPLGVRWQTNQSLYAIGSGGLFGVGLGNSKQKYLYVSEPQNDFIFAIVCEELGFVGACVIMLLFMALVWRGCVIATRSPDKFGMLTAVGLVAQIGIQAALNIAVVTDTIPNTGVSLPFFSAGGTSLVMIMAQMGVVLSVSRGRSAENLRDAMDDKLKDSKLRKFFLLWS